VGIHVVVGAVLVQVLTIGYGIPSWLRFGDGEPPLEERLTFVAPRVPPKPVAQVKPPTTRRATTRRTSVTTPLTAGPEVVSAPSAPRDTGSGARTAPSGGGGWGGLRALHGRR
jgi:hypothetical protein